MSVVNPVNLPNNATLDQMRREAKLLQRGVRTDNPDALRLLARHGAAADAGPDFPLTRAQLVVARAHGFTSWPWLKRYFDTAADLRFEPVRASADETTADRFVRLACLGYSQDDGPERWAGASLLLAAHPELPEHNVWAAAAAGDNSAVTRHLAVDPGLARRRGGVFRWTPLYYLTYSRLADRDQAESLAAGLLTAGADPNEGYLWAGQPSPFTLLTGALGSGELGSARQPALPESFARLLLEAGADPNDSQALYNRQFEPDDSHLRLLFEYGLGRGDGGPWRRLLGDVLGDPSSLLTDQLSWAVDHDIADRVRLLVEHDVDLTRPDRHGHRPADAALLNGSPTIAALLIGAGAPATALSPVDQLIAAVMAGDRAAVDTVCGAHPTALTEALRRRPGLPVWAASRGSIDSVRLVLDLGWSVNVLGRGDTTIEQPWQTALHEAAGNGSAPIVSLLLARGADRTVRDRRFRATPADWARHLDQPEIAELIDGHRPAGAD